MAGKLEVADSTAKQLLNNLSVVSRPCTIVRSGEGGEHLAWVVNNKHVLRIPVDQTSQGPLARERALLDLVHRGNDQVATAIPKCVELATGAETGLYYALYEKVDGISIEADPGSVTQDTEKDLVQFLRALKEVDTDHAARLGVPQAEEVEDAHKMTQEALSAWEELCTTDHVDTSKHIDAQMAFTMPKEAASRLNLHTPVLCHADLKGEHIFVTPSSGHLTGVIDWSDAQIGCPSIDIGGLAISVGAQRAARIARSAGYGEPLIQKGVFAARCRLVSLLREVVSGEDDSPEHLVRTQVDRSLQEFDA